MRFQFKQSYNADINLFRDGLAVRDYLIVLAVFMLAPMVMLSSGGGSTLLDFGTKILIFSIAGLGMMILTGFTGVVSLGHAAFMLLGGLVWALRSWRAEQAEPDDTPVDREGLLS